MTDVRDPASPTEPSVADRIPPDVIRLGLVSFLTDLSSEMIFAVFAVFFTSVAGASGTLLGLVEGLADFSASALSWASGRLSDATGRRKPFALAGYAFSTFAKAMLVMSTAVASLAVFRVVERLGKGFRGPPRDAWLSAIASRAARGRAFGVHQALDKAGAVVGPLVAWALLRSLGETPAAWHLLFVVALVPAVASVGVLALLRERRAAPAGSIAPASASAIASASASARASGSASASASASPGAVAPANALEPAEAASTDGGIVTPSTAARPGTGASPALRRFLLPAGIFAAGYYSLGFLLLKAHASGFDTSEVVLLYALFNATCVLVAPRMGRLGDRIGRARLVPVGYALFAIVNVLAALASDRGTLVAAFALYGLFYAIDESQSRAFVVDLQPDRRASATGLYQTVTGVLYVVASLVAGALWQRSTVAPFAVAAGLSIVAIAVYAWRRPQPPVNE